MRTVELDDRTVELAEQAAGARQCSVDELLRNLLEELPTNRPAADRWLGMLADEPDLADLITESAMTARETQPLRQSDCG